MTRSLTTRHFLYSHTVDLTSLNDFRKKFNTNANLASALTNSDDSVSKLTPLPFIMKAVSRAIIQFPTLNSHLDADTDPNKPQLLIKGSHNFGIAVDTPQGFLVPVVRKPAAPFHHLPRGGDYPSEQPRKKGLARRG